MNNNAKAWVQALRSGNYKQTHGCLHDKEGKYCCLGVACDLAVKAGVGVVMETDDRGATYDGKRGNVPPAVMHWLGLRRDDGGFGNAPLDDNLIMYNDHNRATFQQIASIIEAEPKGLFNE